MSVYLIFDVDVRDAVRFQDFMVAAKPLVEQAGGRYLARGGPFKVLEGDWQPSRMVILEFPSMQAFDDFYAGDYQKAKAIRDECSTARLIVVQGLE